MAEEQNAPSSVGLLAAAIGLASAAVYLWSVAADINRDERAGVAIFGVGALAAALIAAIGSALPGLASRRWAIGTAAIAFLGLGMYAIGTLGMPIVVAGIAAAVASVHAADDRPGTIS